MAANEGGVGGDFSGLKLSAPNGVKVYQVTSGKEVPKWLSEKNARKLRKDADYQRRIELVQDLEFSTASSRVKLSPDGNYLCVTGIHPPQIKVYDLSQLSMKFERHLDAEVVDFTILSDDYSKLALLCADRSVVFHAKFGNYYKTRFPKQGRDLAYAAATGDLMVVGSSNEVYRLNLEQGRFLAPMEAKSDGLNCCGISPAHGLFAAGTEDGTIECFDPRTRNAVGRLDVCHSRGGGGGFATGSGEGVTALRFDPSGMHVATGDHEGIVRIYDLRSSRPVREKDHMYGVPVVDLKYHTAADGARRVISTDRRVVKVWDPSNGNNYTSIEPGQEINDVCVWDKTGLMITAMEHKTLGCYFAPSLGAAPRWCSFLENLTEEMEEEQRPSVYDDYRFVTREELDRLGMSHLIGTSMLRAYMHGFFVDNRLYGKAKAIAEPFSYEKYRSQKVEEKLAAERATRITVKKKAPKVNAALAAKLERDAEKGDGAENKRGGGKKGRSGGDDDADGDSDDDHEQGGGLLKDDRFSAMFKDSAFEVDEESETYKMLHPNAPKLTKREQREMLEEHFDLDDDDDEDEAEEEEEEDEKEQQDDGAGFDDDEDDDEEEDAPGRRGGDGVKMYTIKDERHAAAFRSGRRATSDLSLAARAQLDGGSGLNKKVRVTGNKELSFDASERRGGGGGGGARGKVRSRPGGDGDGDGWKGEDDDGPEGAAEKTWREGGGLGRSTKRRGMGSVLPGGGGGPGRRGGGRVGGGGRGGRGRGRR